MYENIHTALVLGYYLMESKQMRLVNREVASSEEIVAGWQPTIKKLENLTKVTGKTVTCTEVGYQSRNYAWIRGLNDVELDPTDCSSTPNCVNLLAQARAYEGLCVEMRLSALDCNLILVSVDTILLTRCDVYFLSKSVSCIVYYQYDVRRINALYPHAWFNGVYLWLWRTDPDAGGSSDDSYTPQNKPASKVMKSLFLAQ